MSFVEEINTSDKGLKLFYEATFKLRNQSSFLIQFQGTKIPFRVKQIHVII